MIPKLTLEIWKGAAGILAAESLALPAGLAISAMLTRSLGAEGYGHYAVAVAIVGGAEWLIVAAFNRLAFQTLSAGQESLPWFLRHYLLAGLFFFGACQLMAPWAAATLGVPVLTSHLRWLSWDLPLFALAQAQVSFLIAEGRYARRALGSGSRWVVRAAATWAALHFGAGVRGALLAWIAASIGELIVMHAIPARMLFEGWRNPHVAWREGLPLFLFAAAHRVLERVDLLMLQGAGVSGSDTGLYAAAQNLAIFPGLVAGALSPVLISSLIRGAGARGHAEARDASDASLRITILMLPICGFYWGWGGSLASFLFGAPFRGAGKLAALLTAAAIGLALSAGCVSVLSAEGESRRSWLLGVPAMLLSVMMLWCAIPRYGLMGAAAASAIAGLIPALAGWAVIYRRWRRPLPLGTLAGSVAAGAAIYGLAVI